MTTLTPPQQPTHTKRMYYVFAALVVVLVAIIILGAMDNTTVLISPHKGDEDHWLIVAGGGGLVALAGLWWALEGASVGRRIVVSLVFGFSGLMMSILLVGFGGEAVTNYRDFPSGQTIRYTGLLHLSRAYYTHGKSPHGAVQTTPLWADFVVSDMDYDFLRAHRTPAEVSQDPKGSEIPSNGRFCIRVELEQAGGSALRVRHTGSSGLPDGSVILCPPGTPDLPDRFMQAWRAAQARTATISPELMAAYRKVHTVNDGLMTLDAASQR